MDIFYNGNKTLIQEKLNFGNYLLIGDSVKIKIHANLRVFLFEQKLQQVQTLNTGVNYKGWSSRACIDVRHR